MTDDDDAWRSIGDLCKPLSAKVMPKRLSLSLTGEERSQGRLHAMQRQMRDGFRAAARRGKSYPDGKRD
jgi:hypothetical protein